MAKEHAPFTFTRRYFLATTGGVLSVARTLTGGATSVDMPPDISQVSSGGPSSRIGHNGGDKVDW